MENNAREEVGKGKMEDEDRESSRSSSGSSKGRKLSRESVIMLSVAGGLVLLLLVIAIPAIVLTQSSGTVQYFKLHFRMT